jgi:FtsH-binding integral membrane protein
MTTLREMGWQRSLDGLLRLVVAVQVPMYFGAALLHTGARIPLGPFVLAVPNPIPAATVVETILGLAAVANLAVLMRAMRSSTRITLGIQLFLLAGVSLGMTALALRVGPPPSPDWTIHYVMLAGIAAVIVLSLLGAQMRQD